MKQIFIILMLINLAACWVYPNRQAPVMKGLLKGKINGMAIMAPPNPFKENPMPIIESIGVNYVSIQPFAFFNKDQPTIEYGGYLWWGEKKEGLIQSIQLAKKENLAVLLKPQLWAYNQWIGDLEFDNEADWLLFEKNYRNYILPMAKLADSMKVELFAVGTEVKLSAIQRPEFWRGLIQDIRTIYSGKLVYASNWDAYSSVSFWDALDYVGIDAYFPLIKKKRPNVTELKRAWEPTIDSMEAFYNTWQRPILFTEFGYMSLEGCAYKAWLLEKKQAEAKLSEQAQANALQALLEVFGQKSWWAGGFQWKWYADISSVLKKSEIERDYTPQGKKALKVLKELYGNREEASQ
ncbi:hypothetical protein [Aureispira sp. CCB-QB1]|uniref:glycoside hydrolase family 113 n=1 Tax=Aureispira sp. CCB-QB1 TaxID=1313421 RepID=UPI0018CBFF83|nr:hypothetical protein [Aureispira sp. CCB-QB1]